MLAAALTYSPSMCLLGYKTGDIYKSYGDDNYPEFTSLYDDTVIAIKTHTFAHTTTNMYGFKRALVSTNPLLMYLGSYHLSGHVIAGD